MSEQQLNEQYNKTVALLNFAKDEFIPHKNLAE